MLVLTRKQGQAIKIGDDIVIRVTEVRGRGAKALVKIGIQAPSGTKVLREEVLVEVAEEMALAKDPTFELFQLKDPKDRLRD
ncbi:MAG: carbon storage regulator [Bacillota bacterium]